MRNPTWSERRRGSVVQRASGPGRVLFVGHEATRTGAPVMFLHFLRWLRANTDLDFEVLLLNGGPLADEYAEVAPLTVVPALGKGRRSYFEGGLARAGFPRAADRTKVLRNRRALRHMQGFDALYLNSTTSALALRVLPEIPPLVLSHVHELDSAFTYWFPQRDRDIMLAATHRFIACAQAVSRHLIGARGVPGTQVACHYEFIEPPVPDPMRAAELRRSLGIPASARIVGGAGQAIWRKAPDLFIQTAARLRDRRPDLDVHFVWVGEVDNGRMPVQLDIERMGLTDRVHFVGEVRDPADLFSTFDVFCLPSREDPYPLVMLETASLGVPVVAFANGGVVEFAGLHDQGVEPRAVIVPYLDVGALTDSIAELFDDEGRRIAIGRRGQDRVLTEHTVEIGAKSLYEELLHAMANPPGTPVAIDSTDLPGTATRASGPPQATIIDLLSPDPSPVAPHPPLNQEKDSEWQLS